MRAKFLGSNELLWLNLAASRTLLQWLLACLNFFLDSQDLVFCYKQKNAFYELYQQHKQLKTMEIVSLDLTLSMRDIYISSILNPLTKFTSTSIYPPMEHLSNDHKDRLNQHKYSHKQCNEKLASEERNKSKRVGLWESQSGMQVGKLTIWVRSFEIITYKDYKNWDYKNYNRVHQIFQFH